MGTIHVPVVEISMRHSAFAAGLVMLATPPRCAPVIGWAWNDRSVILLPGDKW